MKEKMYKSLFFRQCLNTITFTNKKLELAYFLYFFSLSWLLPILVMTFCYVSIIVTICRRLSFQCTPAASTGGECPRVDYKYLRSSS